MANSLRQVQSRINSTKSTAQITKAMYMVSQSKVKKAEKTYKSYKDFMARIASMVAQIVSKADDEYLHPLLKERTVNKTAYLIITSDKGLAGSYNSSIFKALEERLKCHKSNDEFIVGAIGKQGFNYMKKRKYPVMYNEPTLIRDDVVFVDIEPITKKFIDEYLSNRIDKLVIVYNHFVNSLTQEVTFDELLPIKKVDGDIKPIDFVYENGIEKTLDLLLPLYVKDIIYGIILDAKTSEHSMRMNSMKSATDNANDVIAKLELLYNRARQAVVTNELIDIIGGANAIGGDDSDR
ncbi:MAG: ATP synthase F1 subunit gamma [Acholeplasmatales bacterium]|nr:ATP synthase F1 subunit gamma [Acholeplasmatales bacterium]